MSRNKFLLVVTTIFALAALFVFVQGALAEGVPPSGDCGKSEMVTGSNGLKLKKTVTCEKNGEWDWTILKQADKSELTLALGESFFVNYWVKVDAMLSKMNYKVSGTIQMLNSSGQAIVIESVSDSLGEVSCPVNFPYSLPSGWALNCTYSGSPGSQVEVNKATVVDGNGITVEAIAPIDWNNATGTVVDECVSVNDTFAGDLGTVCAGDQTSFTFTYNRLFKYDECGMYVAPNTAKFVVVNNPEKLGESSWEVKITVPCEGGCTLTPGYWKTHSKYGPAPYDSTWDLKLGGDAIFLGTGKSYYEVLWMTPQGGNAYLILAHAFIAAEMNGLNGAFIPADVQSAWNQAQGLLITYQSVMSIPKNSADRGIAIELAEILDDYNNGLIGPGHCSE